LKSTTSVFDEEIMVVRSSLFRKKKWSHSTSTYLISFHARASTGVRRLVLVLPRAVGVKVLDFPIPTPLLREPPSYYLVAVGSCLVVGITPQVKWSCCIVIHINSKAIDLAILEAVPCQEVIGGSSRAILELSLDSNVDTVRDDIHRPNVGLAVSAWTIFCIPLLGNVVRVDVRVSMNMKTLKWLDY
jgi:hypothetical protein